jgi:hypothetical protein
MIANSLWRRCRVVHQETDWLNGDFKTYQCYYAVTNGADHWQTLSRYETIYERQFYKAIHELERLQRSRRGENIPPHWPLMWTFRSKAKKVHVSQNCQPVESGNQ